jgi:hypothetical protein
MMRTPSPVAIHEKVAPPSLRNASVGAPRRSRATRWRALEQSRKLAAMEADERMQLERLRDLIDPGEAAAGGGGGHAGSGVLRVLAL